ncbi:hypothetical protein [Stackebrandtia nassauensis]|uniref:Uncharacterized protein n=1 Tax=Stackebrandtia nassauensis (strain DSM 44728 / CIP 108903 / NRRL B-16338 / NBRC 102104 / LLR-40K-21) TaxID=446470 RepID=D3Q7Y8_STANL|nr:hypothetical protein [Stackebrandtia nassauensis]ADD40493.1 hypothetical protein Snas_0781 [Stackebrandtia nassauensis DSM 44728]
MSTRGSQARLVIVSVLLPLLVGGFVLQASEPLETWDSAPFAIAVLLGLFAILVLAGKLSLIIMNGLVPGLEQAGRVLAIDVPGIWYIQKRRRILLPWQDIAGVGFTEDPDNKFNFIIEIYPRDADRCGEEELLRQWMVDGAISHHGMPSQRLAFPPMRLDPIRDKVSPAVRAYARRSWVGGRPYASSQRIPGS